MGNQLQFDMSQIRFPRALARPSLTMKEKVAKRRIDQQTKIPVSLDTIKSKLQFAIRELPPATNPSGFTLPMGGTEGLPFDIQRTKSKMLPVYSDIRNGRTRHITIVRKVTGDMLAMKHDLSLVCGGAEVVAKAGHLEVVGDYKTAVRAWLKSLGF
eukprot:c52899_g1_i1.p1 GENE.c52899_g1_i1~~c52899_g1_i1.p1  ORF type:complete len:156 (-),score=27.88 c52899_g1_i1:67-534(-)